MPTINRSALVSFTPEQMYEIVNDVDKYVDFLPWCGASEKLDEAGNEVKASVTIAKGLVNKKFITQNTLVVNEAIEMQLVDGPFKYLKGSWRFDDIKGEACKISLELDFQFTNGLVSLAIGPIFNQIANSMVDAFVERANTIYV